MYDSSQLLFEIGKKFSFYLYPYGKDFSEIISDLNHLIQTNWKVAILEDSAETIVVRVDKCVFCSEIGISCDLFKGFLIHSLEKNLSSDYKVIPFSEKENINDPNHNSFILKLKIEKTFKT